MEEQREQQSYHASSQAYPLEVCPGDEISLLDLWRILVQQRKVICAITGLSVLGAVAYGLLATPVYETQAVVKQPESKYVEVLNVPGLGQISSAEIFAKFTGNLKSSALRQQFVDENPQFSSLRGTVPKIKEGAKNEAGLIFVHLQGYDSKLVADWVNGFILMAERRAIGDFIDAIAIKTANQKKEIENQLQISRDFANQRRLDRIALLESQIVIARVAKISDRQSSGYVLVGQSGDGALDTLQGPMYKRGVKELTAEKEELEKRKNDEPFIAGFRDSQKNLAELDARLKQLQAAMPSARAVTVDQPAIQSKNLVKPRLMHVLVWSVVLGGIIGVFVAFVVNLVQQQKAKSKGCEA